MCGAPYPGALPRCGYPGARGRLLGRQDAGAAVRSIVRSCEACRLLAPAFRQLGQSRRLDTCAPQNVGSVAHRWRQLAQVCCTISLPSPPTDWPTVVDTSASLTTSCSLRRPFIPECNFCVLNCAPDFATVAMCRTGPPLSVQTQHGAGCRCNAKGKKKASQSAEVNFSSTCLVY